MSENTNIIIEPVSDGLGSGRWLPTVGPETMDFLEDVVPYESQETVCSAAVSILAKGTPPTVREGNETGLVVGYVQSGKTMSFEAVAALARDNNFQVVIVIAGRSTSLLEQSSSRLCRDLGLDSPKRPRRWIQFTNPARGSASATQAIHNVLDEWRDPNSRAEFRRTVLVTVLKHHGRLQDLSMLFKTCPMEGVPVLLIDDEADQASLNTGIAQGQDSTTYRRLMELREVLPNHTYLQYTATPQAPLLVSIIDSLSPNFVEVLEPGNAYVGGRELFGNGDTFVRVIPLRDVPVGNDPLREPPESLMEALRVFMVGVTEGVHSGSNLDNRSMLVHPSHRVAHHQEYYDWVRNIFADWKRVLELHNDDPDKLELIQEFSDAYDDLASSINHLPPFNELARSLPGAIRNTQILQVNASAGSTPQVAWRNAYGWILVGGQAMDRGFTVEGLTVTYMPRGIGVGNADTVQQRARFFGYKRPYLGFCRIYLEQGTIDAYRNYVEHEEDIRNQLKALQKNGESLNEWKRAFVLDTNLRPCRQSVLALGYMQGQFSNEWVVPRTILAPDAMVRANLETVETFIGGIEFVDDEGHPDRTPIQHHKIARGVPLRYLIEQLLLYIRFTSPDDSNRNTGLLLQLSHALENEADEHCTVYRMSPNETRHRSVYPDGKISYLFQGESLPSPPGERGQVYPGDKALFAPDTVTVQIHTLDLTEEQQVIKSSVPVIAVWVPEKLVLPWVSQDQLLHSG